MSLQASQGAEGYPGHQLRLTTATYIPECVGVEDVGGAVDEEGVDGHAVGRHVLASAGSVPSLFSSQ
jgi:hypothetical protein